MPRTDGPTDTATQAATPWLLMRLSIPGLSQREVERRLGWKRGHLSLIERGMPPSAAQAADLRAFYLARHGT